MLDHNTAKEKVLAQANLCVKNKVPFFAPKDICWVCGSNLWDKITLKQASTVLITGCPYCQHSYVD